MVYTNGNSLVCVVWAEKRQRLDILIPKQTPIIALSLKCIYQLSHHSIQQFMSFCFLQAWDIVLWANFSSSTFHNFHLNSLPLPGVVHPTDIFKIAQFPAYNCLIRFVASYSYCDCSGMRQKLSSFIRTYFESSIEVVNYIWLQTRANEPQIMKPYPTLNIISNSLMTDWYHTNLVYQTRRNKSI